jgi:Sodium/hydrogen exchanger family
MARRLACVFFVASPPPARVLGNAPLISTFQRFASFIFRSSRRRSCTSKPIDDTDCYLLPIMALLERKRLDWITDWHFVLVAVALLLAAVDANETAGTSEEPSSNNSTNASSSVEGLELDDDAAASDEEGYSSEVYAVLFPWVVQALGIVLYYLLSRGLHAIPYTGVLFIVGTCMGAGATHAGLDDQLTQSITMWTNISHRVLFCTFLPGLLFKDALEINFHLFLASFWQVMYLAFPMVLGGTYMTALVGVYVFPYNWSLNTALTFGSILAATDPVAVCVLLNEVCAPPRLRMHISGEGTFP